MPYCFPRSSINFQGHTVQNITDFDPNWAFPDYKPVAAFKSLRFALFSCDQQLNEWYFPSVCLSVTPFWPCSHHRIVIKFSGFITNDKSDVHAKDQGQGSKVKVTEVITQLSRFQTVTPVLIHQWLWNDAESLKQHRRSALLFYKVIRQISRSYRTKNRRFWPELSVSGL